MTLQDFRRIALSLPEAVESAHMKHPDFRVRDRIFATLGYPDSKWGMVKLTPEEQASFVRSEPAVFVPVKGAWGRRVPRAFGSRPSAKSALRHALVAAWRNVAPEATVRGARSDVAELGRAFKRLPEHTPSEEPDRPVSVIQAERTVRVDPSRSADNHVQCPRRRAPGYLRSRSSSFHRAPAARDLPATSRLKTDSKCRKIAAMQPRRKVALDRARGDRGK